MTRNADIEALHVRISGRVQGVGYRAWCARMASTMGLAGWVRNLRNGDVEAVFCGDASAVQSMLSAAHEGPRWARVDEVEVLSQTDVVGGSFEVRPTA